MLFQGMTPGGSEAMWIRGTVLFFVLCSTMNAASHALHPDSIDRHSLITLTPNTITLVYEVVLGINPTEKASLELDPNQDGVVTDAERDAFIRDRAQQYAELQTVQINDRRLDAEFIVGDAYASTGHHGIHVIKIDLGYRYAIPADLPRKATMPFAYIDHAHMDVPGWKQININPLDGFMYSGHVPYRDYAPFDYEIINTRGYYPSTDDLDGEVWIPDDVAANPRIGVSLPERRQLETRAAGNTGTFVLIGVGLFLLLFVSVIVLKLRRAI